MDCGLDRLPNGGLAGLCRGSRELPWPCVGTVVVLLRGDGEEGRSADRREAIDPLLLREEKERHACANSCPTVRV